MDYPDLTTCLKNRPPALARGPVMVILDEDGIDPGPTVTHHLDQGFAAVLLLAAQVGPLPDDPRLVTVRHRHGDGPLHRAVTAIAQFVPKGTWIGYGHNTEYLFFPFCETRRIGELLSFHSEERRAALTGMVVDLYPEVLADHRSGVDRATACLDRDGYFSLNREDPDQGYAPLDRQVDLYGGLRWRFEEHVPWRRRRIDRVMLFRADRSLTLHEDFTLSDPELNTSQAAWHRSPTCAMASFRTAKALMQSPGARAAIDRFDWPGSTRFRWTSQELMDHGFMEPGQWF